MDEKDSRRDELVMGLRSSSGLILSGLGREGKGFSVGIIGGCGGGGGGGSVVVAVVVITGVGLAGGDGGTTSDNLLAVVL